MLPFSASEDPWDCLDAYTFPPISFDMFGHQLGYVIIQPCSDPSGSSLVTSEVVSGPFVPAGEGTAETSRGVEYLGVATLRMFHQGLGHHKATCI